MAAVSTLQSSDVPQVQPPLGHAVAYRKPAQPVSTGDVKANILYSLPPPPGEQLYFAIYQGAEPNGRPSTNVQTEAHQVQITNLRSLQHTFDIHEEGFQIEKLVVPELDWQNQEQV